jgi:hypothetical protein
VTPSLPRAKIQGAPQGALFRLRRLGAATDHGVIVLLKNRSRQGFFQTAGASGHARESGAELCTYPIQQQKRDQLPP